MQQFYKVVPKGSNPALTGAFVEELVRGFVKDWISPSLLMHGTLYPHDCNKRMSADECKPRQIDGIVYDPRLGPSIIREGSFLVTHPRLCQGIIEIKTSYPNMTDLERHLQSLYSQYLHPQGFNHMTWTAMGIVVQDSDPERHSRFEGLTDPIFHYRLPGHCPIFILFREREGEYEPYHPAVDAMIKALFTGPWHVDPNFTGRPRHPLLETG